MSFAGHPNAWIKLPLNMLRRPETLRLQSILRKQDSWSYVVALWGWASENERSGDLSRMTPAMIAMACDWRGNAAKFVAALKESGYLTEDGKLAGWADLLGVDELPEPKRRLSWSTAAYEEVYARDGRICRYCGTTELLTIDHVVPRIQGGGDEAANLVVACKSCNSRKGGRTPKQAGMTLLPIPGVC